MLLHWTICETKMWNVIFSVCLASVVFCGAEQKKEVLSENDLLSDFFQDNFLCKMMMGPHKKVLYRLDTVQQQFLEEARKPRGIQESEIDLRQTPIENDNSKLASIVNVNVFNDTHVTLTLKHMRECAISKDKMVFKKFEGINGNKLNASDFQVEWTNKESSRTLIEHDSRNLVMLIEESGWTRVFYDDLLFQHIVQQLQVNPNVFPRDTKIFLLDDQFGVGSTGATNYSTALDLTRFIDKEHDSYIWAYVSLVFYEISMKFSAHPKYHLFENYVASKTEPLLKTIGSHEQSLYLDKKEMLNRELLRSYLLMLNCNMGGALCTEYAKTFLAQWNTDKTMNPVRDTSPSVIYRFVEIGGRIAYDAAFEIYEKFSDPSVVHLLSASRDPEVISDLFAKILSMHTSSQEPKINLSAVLKGIAANPVARPMFLDLLSANVGYIIAINNAAEVASLLNNYGSFCSSQNELAQVEAFANKHATQLNEENKKVKNVIQKIRSNIVWAERNSEDISYWLEKQ